MTGRLYRVLDPDFYRARAESRVRLQRHLRRKALLRKLLSREVRIAIAVIMAGMVLLAYSFAAPRDGGLSSPSARLSTSRVAPSVGEIGARVGLDLGPGDLIRRIAKGDEPLTSRGGGTPHDPQYRRASGASRGRPGEITGREPSLAARATTARMKAVTAGRDRHSSQTLDGTPDPSRRTPAQSAKAFVAAQFLLFLSLALGCFLVLYGFRLAREAERESEGKVTDGWLRRNRPGGWE